MIPGGRIDYIQYNVIYIVILTTCYGDVNTKMLWLFKLIFVNGIEFE